VNHLEALIVGLVDTLPGDAGGPQHGVRVKITSIDLAIPVETHVDAAGLVRASLPRGRLATGYEVVLSRMALRFARTASEDSP
jgi:hypothetical protein